VNYYKKKNLKAEAPALAGLVLVSLAENNLTTAQELIEQIKTNFSGDLNHTFVRKAFSAYELASQATGNKQQIQDLVTAVQNNPNDLQARYDLALAYFQHKQYEPALIQCLDLIKKNRDWQDQAARKLILKIFDVLGSKDPLTKKGRKQLANLLF